MQKLLCSLAVAGLAFFSNNADAAHAANGKVHDFVLGVKVVSSVDGAKPARCQAQFGYRNEGSSKASGTYKVSGPVYPSTAATSKDVVFKGGNETKAPRSLRFTYESRSNLVGSYEYLAWDASEGKAVTLRKGTETAPNLKGKLTPTVTSVVDNGDGTFTASFGYVANWHPGITYPVTAAQNRVLPGRFGGTVPSVFSAGVHDGVASITVPNDRIARYNLGGIVVTASAPGADN